MSQLSPIQIDILWKRLVTAVDEAATTLVRASFSSVIRDFHDYACALFDRRGRMLAQSTHSTPGLLGILPFTIPGFLAHPLAKELRPGDVLVTNDPWLASGHLIDVTVATPVFRGDEVVGFVLSVVHHLNMGGRLATLASRDVYEEGLKIPILRLFREGQPEEAVFEFIRANVREGGKVIGDLRAQVAANEAAARKLLDTMELAGLTELETLGDEIISRSEASMRAAIRELPPLEVHRSMQLRGVAGYEEPVTLALTVRIRDGEVELDFAGTSAQIPRAVNVTLNMTRSYSVYPLKCVLDPGIPNNEGCLRPIRILAPEGSVLNARFPAATWGRTVVAHMLPELIIQALSEVVPGRLVSGSGSTPLWYGNLAGRYRDGRTFFAVVTMNGGLGARATRDGIGAISYPANVANIPVEVIESDAPILFECKELAPEAAGAGRHRGGAGQRIVLRVPESAAEELDGTIQASIRGGRFGVPIEGLQGGLDGGIPFAELNGRPAPLGSSSELAPGDRLELVVPGGAGYGPPSERATADIERDIADELIGEEEARRLYGDRATPAAAD
ncbi:N-methylhydantoinase B [Allostella sp. ATCC 35155]|nr:N-methylhydantoinase B [Stella sp. ATCC 35155]